ncbi:type II toxin-antitoxin system PemK/MazF family toxin [Staphylococcus agnetis]|uniref:Endoribonuclease MazF n=1 Tax=Staphylococcus agnetis TaxID=985762 RepID=A0A2T4MC52_9STAP|nr:type II toxin-antitoxin system PemK/MazF family toxin [Staphylococcus agnetis]NJI02321.1 type II toxin-antitoxin system PemK/MazF family toxin [Staphylococcus agnetis]PTH26104.1 type II toxin-antitoxin system PemK/MazF family toxin [Staphylococcus agnetis]PTH37121.1 type II toxin-antitoxin system PemK/MazF family toxin [Staphylococcus agnetis]
MVNQYSIIRVNLNPTKGREKGKYRPCIVLSATYYNLATGFVWAVPITSRDERYPTDIKLKTKYNNITGIVDLAQIKTLDLKARDYELVDEASSLTVNAIKPILISLLCLK